MKCLNKRGDIGLTLANVFSLVTLFLIFIVAYYVFSAPLKPSTDVIEGKLSGDSSIIMLNYLRYNFNNEQISDIIINNVNKNDFNKLREATNSFFKYNKGYWFLKIYKDSKEEKNLLFKLHSENLVLEEIEAKSDIKMFNPYGINEYIIVELTLGSGFEKGFLIDLGT